MSEMIVEALGSRLYPIDFLPHQAETKLQGPIAVTDVNRIEDRAVNQ
jgi:hypothetical protein